MLLLGEQKLPPALKRAPWCLLRPVIHAAPFLWQFAGDEGLESRLLLHRLVQTFAFLVWLLKLFLRVETLKKLLRTRFLNFSA